MNKQILSLMLAFLLFFGLCAPTAQAAAMTWDGWTPISSEEDLRAIENNLTGKYYLTNNIVLSGPWLPLGDMGDYSNTFKGTFDGNGFTISNLQASEEGSIGLFHYCSGKIRNLTLSVNAVIGADSSVSTGYIGGIASSLYSGGVISNCTVTGSMEVNIAEGVACVGGISGTNSGSIEDCTSSLNITAMDTYADGVGGNLYLGGITGVNNSTVKRCTNSGALRGHDRWNYIGGIVGRMNQDGTIEQCSNSGTVHGTCLLEEDYSEVYAGGIVGNALSDSNPIVRCFNTGNVTSEASYYIYAGGIAGFSATDLTECYNTGTITGVNRQLYTTSDYAELTIGGIVGYLAFNTPAISHCYNTGKLVYKPYNDLYAYRHYTPFAGGIAGIAYDNTISDCYSMGTVSLGSRYTYWVGGIVGMDWGGPGSPCNYANVYWYKSGYTAALYQNRSGTTADTTGAVTTLSSFASQDTFSGFTFGTAWSMGETNPLLIYTVPHTHNLAKYSGVNPTCTAAGRADYWMCRSCYVYFRDQGFNTVSYADLSIPKVDHSYTDWSTVLEPGCTSTGTEERGCGNCTFTESRTIDSLGHTYASVVTDPTCTEDGYTTYTCSRCDDTYTDSITAALGHSFTSYVSNNNASCTADGTKTAKCDLCDATDTVTDEASALGHDWADATCTEPKTCSRCSSTEGDPNGHSYTETVTAPTCTEQGFTTYTCTCGDSYVDTYTDAVGHTETVDAAVPATCIQTGLTEGSHCSVCQEILTPQQEVPLADHAWDEGAVTLEPTEDETGIKTYACNVCDETKEETIPVLEHVHLYTDTVTAPTCTEQGFTTHTCRCGNSYVDTYTDAAGHTETVDAAVPATCIQTGLTEGSHCSVCQEILTPQQELPLTDHAWDEGAVTLEPTEDETGIKTYACTVCSETREEAIPVLPHTHSHTAVITPPTCTEDGYTTHTCVCGDSYTDTPTAALGHSFAGGKCSTCGAADPNYTPPAANPFTDVTEDAFYFIPVQWALENNITTGLTATQFGPMEDCTRGQVVTFLWRAAGQPEPSSLINPFDDVKTSDFFYKAVLWAVEEGITAGYGSSNIFNPSGICNRGQVATFLHRYAGTPAPGSYHNPFTDVSSGAFYYDAVLWAVERGITNGYGSDTIFNPDGNCTRGQIVTFLYRALTDS